MQEEWKTRRDYLMALAITDLGMPFRVSAALSCGLASLHVHGQERAGAVEAGRTHRRSVETRRVPLLLNMEQSLARYAPEGLGGGLAGGDGGSLLEQLRTCPDTSRRARIGFDGERRRSSRWVMAEWWPVWSGLLGHVVRLPSPMTGM